MLPWLDSHAGAVQSLAAVASVLLTAMLAYVTWRYTNLTNRIATIAEKQLASIDENDGTVRLYELRM
jgi:hypothetical protein